MPSHLFEVDDRFAIGTGLYLLGLGFLCGVVADRVAFDQHRIAVLRHDRSAIEHWHADRMALAIRDPTRKPGMPQPTFEEIVRAGS